MRPIYSLLIMKRSSILIYYEKVGGIMSNADYKSTDALMRHLRGNGIAISGSLQKQQLINTGYFHGYKGYRFFVQSNHRLPFVSYNEINATIQYDTKLKSLLYDKVMFIETALKNHKTLFCFLRLFQYSLFHQFYLTKCCSKQILNLIPYYRPL